MNRLAQFFCVLLFFSCGGNSAENSGAGNILENLTFTSDTVVVDSGEDIIILSNGLGAKMLSEDMGTLLFFEREPLNLVEVDLDNLKLIQKTPFQKEGPNGVGPYLIGFQLGPGAVLFIQGYNSQGKFNTRGELTQGLKVVPEGIDSELANNFQKLYAKAVFDFEKERIYSQPSGETLREKELFIIDPLTKAVRIEPIPEMKAVEEFSGTLITKSGESTMFRYFSVGNYMYLENGQLLITAGSMSGIYRLDLKTDSIHYVPIQHRQFPDRMQITVTNLPTDEAQFYEDQRKVNAALNYLEPLWDETRQMYLRLGKKTFLGEKRGDPSTYEVFLFAYDKDFNVLGETMINGLTQIPNSYFWKNGKLWSYVNVADELGFAVMDFKF
jgi:hypothetical protein